VRRESKITARADRDIEEKERFSLALERDQLQSALARVKLLVLDVDGVMTDGGIFVGDREELKRYDTHDVTGIKYLMRHGVEVAVITGRQSVSVERHCADLGIEEVHQRQLKKLPAFLDLLERRGLAAGEVAVLADDLMELPLMRRAGVGIAVADASDEVRDRADWVTRAAGGRGAVREVAEAILKAKGLWAQCLERYLE
jgi:3-deoxy-D-manno-octulosonate 8-phosphate phosphatase (KDO 8-P phosphatase)